MDKKLPICVDLDGTLLQTDMLWESALDLLRHKPFECLKIPYWISQGKAVVKRELAQRYCSEPETLPYNTELLEYLHEQHANGRQLFLVTASDQKIADSIGNHLQIFSGIYGSDGVNNLKGKAKLRALVDRWGDQGFVYAGNDRSDLAVWEKSASAILVNTPRNIATLVDRLVPVEKHFPRKESNWIALLRELRIYQWVKNSLVFVPLLAAHQFTEASSLMNAVQVFFAFGFCASAIYIVNDLLDLSADRKHPRKRKRPFASGALELRFCLAAPCLLLIGLWLAFALPATTGGIVAAYVVLSVAYSFGLKTKPLVDVFVLATLYSLRLLAGGVATGIPVSIWLLSFSSFLFLALAFLKRDAEMASSDHGGERIDVRRGYRQGDADALRIMGIASSFTSCLVLALYVESSVANSIYRASDLLWGIVPLALFWQCRLWLSTARGHMHDDPIVFAAKDWVSWVVFLSASGFFVLASIGGATPLTG